ncbi:hypothetical protein BD769DRAFT_1021015 [Suillus cothurnatus]|nr:hypothetical protein BD769DRAFT_1021015 [Suillus cothurnatus]
MLHTRYLHAQFFIILCITQCISTMFLPRQQLSVRNATTVQREHSFTETSQPHSPSSHPLAPLSDSHTGLREGGIFFAPPSKPPSFLFSRHH